MKEKYLKCHSLMPVFHFASLSLIVREIWTAVLKHFEWSVVWRVHTLFISIMILLSASDGCVFISAARRYCVLSCGNVTYPRPTRWAWTLCGSWTEICSRLTSRGELTRSPARWNPASTPDTLTGETAKRPQVLSQSAHSPCRDQTLGMQVWDDRREITRNNPWLTPLMLLN